MVALMNKKPREQRHYECGPTSPVNHSGRTVNVSL